VVRKVKKKAIQEMIQIDYPVNYFMDNTKKIANKIKNIELYNATMLHTLPISKLK
jgi:hypothetical protein